MHMEVSESWHKTHTASCLLQGCVYLNAHDSFYIEMIKKKILFHRSESLHYCHSVGEYILRYAFG